MSTTEVDTAKHVSEVAGADFVAYEFRPALMSPPREFVVEPDALAWTIGRHSGRVPYRSIRRIRLSYRPVTLQMHRFQLEIWSDAAPKLVIASTSWRSMVEQTRQDPGYRAFVLALHRRMVEAGAAPVLKAGVPPFVYWPGVAVFVAMALILPWMLMKTARGDAVWGTALIALVIGVFLWQIGGFFWRNRPANYTAGSIPDAVLPRG